MHSLIRNHYSSKDLTLKSVTTGDVEHGGQASEASNGIVCLHQKPFRHEVLTLRTLGPIISIPPKSLHPSPSTSPGNNA